MIASYTPASEKAGNLTRWLTSDNQLDGDGDTYMTNLETFLEQ